MSWKKMYEATEPELVEKAALPAIKEEVTFADFDDRNPRALINLVPTPMKAAIQMLPTDYYEMEEEELRRECFGLDEDGHVAEPDATTARLRIAFWDEYDRCQRYQDEKLDLRNVTRGICSEIYFFRRFIIDQRKLAFLLHPPTEYAINLKELHVLSLRALRAALKLPVIDKSGRPNVKLIEAQNKIFQHLDMRLKGAIIQRIDQRNVNVNVDATPKEETKEQITGMSMAELERRIESLRHESNRLLTPSQVKVDLLKDVSEPQPEVVGEEEKSRSELP